MPEETKTPRQVAQEALDAAQRKEARLAAKVERLRGELKDAELDLKNAAVTARYRAADPRLQQENDDREAGLVEQ